MIREEAIAILKAFMENPLFNDAHKQAFNIAIHDIKQRHDWDINNLILINKENYEPAEQEPKISKEKAIEILKADNIAGYSVEDILNARDMAIKAIKQEPRKGHWILDETDNSITCDKCGCLIWANDISNGEAYYCPNCGAKMEGV